MAEQQPRRKPLVHPKPTPTTVKQLYGTAFRCAKPGCLRPLYRMNDDTGEWLLNSSVAHIHARSEGGPRWASEMSASENQSASNLLPLCNDHAAEIDNTPEHYPADLLREWKREQLQEYRNLNRSWPVNDAQAEEISAVSFDPRQAGITHAGSGAVIGAVRCSGLMVETARSRRLQASEVVDAWNAVRDRATRTMPVFDQNGERLRVEPPRIETDPIRAALLDSLKGARAALQDHMVLLVSELHAVQAANPKLGPWCNWVEQAARQLTHEVGRWENPPEPDGEVLSEAANELTRAAQMLAGAWRGDDVTEPPPSLTLLQSQDDETDLAREARLHRELLDRAKPWSRVTHREFDADLYEELVCAAGNVAHLPQLLSLLPVGLDTTTRLAAGVARNADDSTLRALIDRACEIRPLAVAGFLLKHLAIMAGETDRGEIRGAAHEKVRQILLAEQWQDVEVWAANQAYVLHLLHWTAQFSDPSRVRMTLESALEQDADLLPLLLAGVAQWSEPLDDGRGGVIRGPSSRIDRLPDWFPTTVVLALISERMPDVVAADEDTSERYTDEAQRYASQVLWLAAGNPSPW
ncbi:hypothetical protein [Streptomyces sp. JV178]|uniref:hypothetical protein n=1 Tax=Streptomyces sp. JV178 TaxID=858632 RepID=UPI00117DA155|nr:hypothetical protein [Streptomyces sp. JV178]